MTSGENETGRNHHTLKENKSVGYLLLNNKWKLKKLREKQRDFMSEIGKLNESLKKSESLINLPSSIKKNNSILKFFNKSKEKHFKKRRFKSIILPDIARKQNLDNNKIDDKKDLKKFLTKNYGISNYLVSPKNKGEEDIPFYLKGLNFKKRSIPASLLIKESKNELYKRNPFKKYCYDLEEKIGNYVENQDKYSPMANFNELLKKYIKDELIGMSIPGNILHRDAPGFIRTIHPKNVKEQIKKRITVPNKTLVPVPNELAGKGISYTHITLKDVYNDKDILI